MTTLRRLALSLVLFSTAWALAQSSPEPPRTSPKFSAAFREPPDREADALHLRLEVAFDWEKKEVAGKVTHTFRALRDGLRSITLDAVRIQVLRVLGPGGSLLAFESRPESLWFDLGRDYRRGEEIGFTVEYRCRPDRGVYFRSPDSGYPDSPKQVWTQGEPVENRHWIPCFDHPVDKVTSEVLVFAPEGLTALSNGRLEGDPSQAPGGGRVFHWVQEKPHATYLIAVVVGDFAEYRDQWNQVPLVAYVPRSHAADAERSFKLTRDIMQFYFEKTGVAYPWAKYGQVCVNEFMMGGMENTSLTILTERTLHDATADLDIDSTGLVAHELAHQWFGDLVTCKDWSDIWLNESFATFWENLYLEKLRGWDEAAYERMEEAERYKAEDRGSYRRPLVSHHYRDPDDVFDAHAYPKGARIISMLRYVLGDERFFAGIRRYLESRAYQSAETSDLRQAMEEVSGASLQWFFDQWVMGGGHPEYKVSAEWDERSRMERVQVRQTQRVDAVTALFRMPIEIELVSRGGRALHRVEVSRPEETFSFPATERPLLVRFDKRDWVLKELDFPRSREDLLYQLENDEEVSGRIGAARGLASQNDEDVRAALLRRLSADPFWGVRLEVAKVLGGLGGEAARDGLQRAFKGEKKSQVRREIVQSLGHYPGAATLTFLREVVAGDPSYFVVGDALRSISRIDKKEGLQDGYRALGRDSYYEEIRTAAIEAIAKNDGLAGKERDEALDRLLQLHRRGQPIPVRVAAGRALAKLGRGVERVYQELAGTIDDETLEVRFGVISELADLGDRRAIEVLRNRRGKESRRAFRDPLDAIDGAVKRLEGVNDHDQVLEELRRLREARDELERRVKVLEQKGGERKGSGARQF
jgi:aminopeptidase N